MAGQHRGAFRLLLNRQCLIDMTMVPTSRVVGSECAERITGNSDVSSQPSPIAAGKVRVADKPDIDMV
jgi:hypothetical protein